MIGTLLSPPIPRRFGGIVTGEMNGRTSRATTRAGDPAVFGNGRALAELVASACPLRCAAERAGV
jgi:hypothetical protein